MCKAMVVISGSYAGHTFSTTKVMNMPRVSVGEHILIDDGRDRVPRLPVTKAELAISQYDPNGEGEMFTGQIIGLDAGECDADRMLSINSMVVENEFYQTMVDNKPGDHDNRWEKLYDHAFDTLCPEEEEED